MLNKRGEVSGRACYLYVLTCHVCGHSASAVRVLVLVCVRMRMCVRDVRAIVCVCVRVCGYERSRMRVVVDIGLFFWRGVLVSFFMPLYCWDTSPSTRELFLEAGSYA